MSAPDQKVPDYLVEMLHQDALPEATAARVKARLAEEPGGRERLDRLEAADAEALKAHPPFEMVHAIESKLRIQQAADRVASQQRAARSEVRLMQWAGPAVGALVALLFVLPHFTAAPDGPLNPSTELPGFTERPKGDARLLVHRKQADTPEKLKDGAAAQAGDVLQVGYHASGAAQGVIVSIDGRGAVTLHHPASPEGSTALKAGAHQLDHAYQLDDAPAFERFFFVTGEAVQVEAVLSAARALARDTAQAQRADLPVSEGQSVATFVIRKSP